VGGFFFIHRDDLKAMSHLWLKYAEDVRADPEVRPRRANPNVTFAGWCLDMMSAPRPTNLL
jgi:hypothetical protein